MESKNLELDEKEQRLKRVLIDVASWIDRVTPITGGDGELVPTVTRWTGGWVRDKLLDIPSHDIDIAINNMTGSAFALRMNEYLEQPGNLDKYGIDKIHGVHDIKSNPEKSKHLDTVTTKLMGLDLDFVNLRKEVYDQTSRIPQIEPTDDATEDALRRDATINAMFYNLQDSRVEDLTQRGFDDLKAGIIQTPLEPVKTFRDDPLRILRLIRFASRYNFRITPDAKMAVMDADIKAALQRKISRERVGVEVDKMLAGPDPQMALSLIDALGLYSTIFSVPDLKSDFEPDTSSWRLNYSTVQKLLASAQATDYSDMKTNENHEKVKDVLIVNKDSEHSAWILSCFVPYFDAPELEPAKGKKSPPLAAVIARDGLKWPNRVTDVVASSVMNTSDILDVKATFTNKKQAADGQEPRGRDTLGKAIRRWGATWRSQALFAYLLDIQQAQASERDALNEWAVFLSHLKEEDLLEVYNLKPVIDGKTLAKALDVRPGPWMKDALEVVISWQLRNPSTSTVEAAISAVTASPQTPLGKNLPPYSRSRDDNKTNGEVQHPGQQRKRALETQSNSNADTGELTASLIAHFLHHTIRPLFSKTTASYTQDTITSAGRAKTPQPLTQRKHETFEDETLTRPWKAPDKQTSLDLLCWSVENLTPALTESQWPSLIPPLLTLLDDTETVFRARGASLLTSLLSHTPPSLLSRTGLADVFYDALRPSLHALPTLTPASESAALLSKVYPALFTLTALRHAQSPKDEKTALAQILHEHLLPSLSHIEGPVRGGTTYPALTVVLLTQISTLVQRLGVDAIAEVQHLLPVLRGLIADDPFAVDSNEGVACVVAAIQTLTTLVAAAWMRAYVWRGDVLDIIAGGWIRRLDADVAKRVRSVEDEGSLGESEGSLRVAVEVIVRAVDAGAGHDAADTEYENGQEAGGVDLVEELRQIVDADPRLEGLFGNYAAR